MQQSVSEIEGSRVWDKVEMERKGSKYHLGFGGIADRYWGEVGLYGGLERAEMQMSVPTDVGTDVQCRRSGVGSLVLHVSVRRRELAIVIACAVATATLDIFPHLQL